MATTTIKSIKPSGGGDYTTLAAWYAARKGDLVATDRIEIAEVYTGTDATALNVASAGVVTDETHYFLVRPATGYEHGGKWNTDVYKFSISASNVWTLIDIRIPYFHIKGIQIETTPVMTGTTAVRSYSASAGYGIIDGCILKIDNSAYPNTIGIAQYLTTDIDHTLRCSNNIVIGNSTSEGAAVKMQTYGKILCYNNTAYKFKYGFYKNASTGTFRAKNCLAQACTDGFYGIATYSTDSTNNCSSVASDAPTLNRITGNVQFVDTSDYDLHLSASDTVARGAGADLSADAYYPFSTDIDGQTIATWSIGADSIAVASGGQSITTDSAWRITTAMQADSSWSVLATQAASTVWGIFASALASTAWALFGSAAANAAWRVLDRAGGSLSWKDFSSREAGSSWRILDKKDAEVSWGILGSWQLSADIAWRIITKAQAAVSWRILDATGADTGWQIIRVNDANMSWRILESVQSDAAWRVMDRDQALAAWGIESDVISLTPSNRIAKILAESRTVLVSQQSRLIVVFTEPRDIVIPHESRTNIIQ